jgi:hypothetical protein
MGTCDFNGDGLRDLATGAPGGTVSGLTGAGRIDVVYGDVSGLAIAAASRRTWDQSQLGTGRSPQAGASFGAALAGGDFNGDGFCDLAVGVPNMDFSSKSNAGLIDVLYGSASGLIAVGVPGVPDATVSAQRFSEDTTDLDETATATDRFGARLASGDFNDDGYADLAIGTPGYDIPQQSNPFVPGVTDAGLVHVLYGTSAGLQVASPADQVFKGDRWGETFGDALATGDFNRDGKADLAVGAPMAVDQNTSASIERAGRVDAIYGSATGLTGTGRQRWYEYTLFNQGTAQDDRFGTSLAVGDFDNDTDDDLAIGIPGDDSPIAAESGKIAIVRGGISGLFTTGVGVFSQDSNGIVDTREAHDQFGRTMVAGNFNGDAYDDLAVGAPSETAGSVGLSGFVNVIFGSLTGLTGTGSQGFSQDTAGIQGGCETSDAFAFALAAGDFNGDGQAELAVGVPYEDISSGANNGVVNVLYGSAAGITADGNQLVQ